MNEFGMKLHIVCKNKKHFKVMDDAIQFHEYMETYTSDMRKKTQGLEIFVDYDGQSFVNGLKQMSEEFCNDEVKFFIRKISWEEIL